MVHIAKTPKGPRNKEHVPVTQKMHGKGMPQGTKNDGAHHVKSPATKPLPSPAQHQGGKRKSPAILD